MTTGTNPFANGLCTFGEDRAPGAGCIKPAGHDGAHCVLPGDVESDDLDPELAELLNRCPAAHGALGRICELPIGHAGMHTGSSDRGGAAWGPVDGYAPEASDRTETGPTTASPQASAPSAADTAGLPVNTHGGYCPHCGRGDCSPDIPTYTAMAAALARVRQLADEMRDFPNSRWMADQIDAALTGQSANIQDRP